MRTNRQKDTGMNSLDKLKKYHTRWLESFQTSPGQREDSQTILDLITEIEVMRKETALLEATFRSVQAEFEREVMRLAAWGIAALGSPSPAGKKKAKANIRTLMEGI
jgi:hypothetical protein